MNTGSRRVRVAGMTCNPTGPWVEQQARNLAMDLAERGEKVTYLLKDGDTKFTGAFDEIFRTEGIKVQKLPFASPNLNAHAERFVQAIKHECLNHFVAFGERHLEFLLREYEDHYSDWARQVHPEDLPRFEVEIKECLAERRMFELEYRVVWPDGSVHWIACRRVFTQDASQRMLGISMDITERKRIEEALRETQAQLKAHTDNLEKTVVERTAKLWEETAEREKLQEELLKISEREKQLIAQEMHDGLCQHFAGTAMMASILHRSLVARQAPEAVQTKEICDLLNTGVLEARNLSHGLHPVKDKGDGLMEALSGLAQKVTKLFHIQCSFCCDEAVLINSQETATHFFRIAQEAMNNAIKHGQASKVMITLKQDSEGVSLSIRDNGIGIPRKMPATKGMGMQIMNHRADVIGAALTICRAGKRGTVVTCTLPARW